MAPKITDAANPPQNMTVYEMAGLLQRITDIKKWMLHMTELTFFQSLPGWECLADFDADFDLVININYNTQGFDIYYADILVRSWFKHQPEFIYCYFESVDKCDIPIYAINFLIREINDLIGDIDI